VPSSTIFVTARQPFGLRMWSKRGLDDALRFEAMNAAVGFVSDDLLEGFAAGREKRAPRFEGK